MSYVDLNFAVVNTHLIKTMTRSEHMENAYYAIQRHYKITLQNR